MRSPRILLLPLLVLQLALVIGPQALLAQNLTDGQQHVQPDLIEAASSCDSEWQIVMCGDIPADALRQRAECCNAQRPAPLSPDSAAAVAAADGARAAARQQVERRDVGENGTVSRRPVRYQCTAQLAVQLPSFSLDAAGRTQMPALQIQAVPALTKDVIRRVKDRAIQLGSKTLRAKYAALNSINAASGFRHPGGFASAAELAAMQTKLAVGGQPQAAARDSLLKGTGVPPKVYPGGWYFRTDCPADYSLTTGPLPMAKLEADYGGTAIDQSACPAKYPGGAPRSLCGHISFVEADGMMAYKQALAYFATGDQRYASQSAAILTAWSSSNTVFGLRNKNGPLEAAWGCGSMVRAAELLKGAGAAGLTTSRLVAFRAWAGGVLMPQMDHFIDVITPNAVAAGRKNVYGNWHAAIADCFVAFGVFSDDRARYNKGVSLYRTTVKDYFKWGRGQYAAGGRLFGESTETLRDIYHTEFGLGSLLQAAESAWVQDDDVYGENDYALAAAMELHARIINAADAGRNEALLPPGFRFFESMPPPPSGCSWKWDIETQRWASYSKTTNAKCSDLTNGVKYVLGAKWLPTGWELGYNHYSGRLGMRMPETAALLARYRIEHFEFCWGLGTLSHADTAGSLWRAGLVRRTLCGASRGRR